MSGNYKQTMILLLESDRAILDRLIERNGGGSMASVIRKLIRDAGRELLQEGREAVTHSQDQEHSQETLPVR